MKRSVLLLLAAVWLPVCAAAQTPAPRPNAGMLYWVRCASCHGIEGKGDGEYAGLLSPRPRDFTTGRYKFRTTETGSLPTDEDLARSITDGLHGSSMPGWRGVLSAEQVQALVEQVKSFSPRFASEQPRPIAMGPEPPSTPQAIEAGRGVYEKLKCAACHGTDGRGASAIARDLKDDWGRPTRATNLDEPWAFRGGSGVRDIFLRFRTGMNGTPMPSFIDAASESELWQLASYVKSIGRKPLWEMKGDEVAAFYRARDEEDRKDPVKRGEYIANISGCVQCHSPYREDNTMIEELKLAGGQRFRITPFGDFVAYNLTSDKETGLGDWTDEQIKTFVTTGVRRDGSRMLPFPMPWPNFAHMSASDLDALVAFLRSLPPVSNRIPPPQAPNIFSYLAGKFRMLILHEDQPLYMFPGNAGSWTDGARP
ncbi:MAG: c-type cytochrome [Acidobacteria bacterium]|nr:c-type cytochrome [Acidobacteriota bacterium]